jgi:UDP-N-acetylmuramate dehydrogenase
MKVDEHVPLSSRTTFRIGGPARYLITASTEDDVRAARAFAREKGLPWTAVAGGSNVLAGDAGYEGVIITPELRDDEYALSFVDDGGGVLLVGGAGHGWDAVVDAAASRGLWGIENLAGIPGTLGAAPVQNIGAYGAELRDVLAWVEALDESGAVHRLQNEECSFGYRESRFKRDPSLTIMKVALRLSRAPAPRLSYKDLAAKAAAGAPLTTPAEVGSAVRSIRAGKFPDLREWGTAGSFFKNPVIPDETYAALRGRYPDLPGFPHQQDGGLRKSTMVKVPLAFILDRVLGLRGHALGAARLFEKQPLVIVAARGANAHEVEALAYDVAARVRDAVGIDIEREVRSL